MQLCILVKYTSKFIDFVETRHVVLYMYLTNVAFYYPYNKDNLTP